MTSVRLTILFLFIGVSIQSFSQVRNVTVSGMVKDKGTPLPYVNVVLLNEKDNTFVSGTVSNDEGRFSISNVKPGNYELTFSFIGYVTSKQPLYVGSLSDFLDLATIELTEDAQLLNEVVITGQQKQPLTKGERRYKYGDLSHLSKVRSL